MKYWFIMPSYIKINIDLVTTIFKHNEVVIDLTINIVLQYDIQATIIAYI